MSRRGYLVVTEGGDGCGKSSVSRFLAQQLSQRGVDVVLTREPGGGATADRIRELVVTGEPGSLTPMSELLLFAAARIEHIRSVIAPALARGAVVISDRYVCSTLAYQGWGGGVDLDWIRTLHRVTTGNLMPDLMLYLDIAPDAGLARSSKRLKADDSSEDRFERMGAGFHARVREGFLSMASGPDCVTMDASAPLEIVQARALEIVQARVLECLPPAGDTAASVRLARTVAV